ncbi:hypothetical protein [Haloferax sp. YSSS75]|uniref:hypothetical protein n=1 Tax=Haloferax sp. YSSS75 TaxID=3388564 RepID=UPI00398CCB7B
MTMRGYEYEDVLQKNPVGKNLCFDRANVPLSFTPVSSSRRFSRRVQSPFWEDMADIFTVSEETIERILADEVQLYTTPRRMLR